MILLLLVFVCFRFAPRFFQSHFLSAQADPRQQLSSLSSSCGSARLSDGSSIISLCLRCFGGLNFGALTCWRRSKYWRLNLLEETRPRPEKTTMSATNHDDICNASSNSQHSSSRQKSYFEVCNLTENVSLTKIIL